MTRIRFEDLPSTNTPRNAENLNKLNNVVISSTEPNTGEEVWLQKGKNLFNKNAPIYRQVSVASTTILNTGLRINLASTNSGVYAAYYIGKYSDFFGQTMTVKSIIQPNSSRKVMLNIWAITGGPSGTITALSEQDATGTNVTITNSYTFNNSTYNDYDVLIGLYAKTGSGSVTTSDYTDFTDLQVELNSTATTYEAYIDKKIYTKNDNDVYEKFYDESKIKNFIPISYTNYLNLSNNVTINSISCYKRGNLAIINYDLVVSLIAGENVIGSGTSNVLTTAYGIGRFIHGTGSDRIICPSSCVLISGGAFRIYTTNTGASTAGTIMFLTAD